MYLNRMYKTNILIVDYRGKIVLRLKYMYIIIAIVFYIPHTERTPENNHDNIVGPEGL